MAFQWTDAAAYPYQEGGVFLGLSDTGQEVGITTEKGLITIASARTGKGATLIIPNLLRWKSSVCVIDPKGEAADETAARRAAMGQVVGVVDPYHEATKVPDELRVSINPLDLIDRQSRTVRLQLEALGDGLIRRFNPLHAQWDNKAASILSGVAAHVLDDAPPEKRTLKTVRKLMMQPDAKLKGLAEDMIAAGGIGGLPRDAGLSILEKFSDPKSIAAGGFDNAVSQTGWIDDESFDETLGGLRPFDLQSLKAGNGSLYLVLHPDHLKDRGGFLRLFVRMSMSAMTTSRTGGKCLFILDEFAALGRMENILSAAGSLPGYGISLWPFLQDLGQLHSVYDENAAYSFFSNSDAHIFFGSADELTLGRVAQSIGQVQPHEIGDAPIALRLRAPTGTSMSNIIGGHDAYSRIAGGIVGGGIGATGRLLDAAADYSHQKAMNDYQKKVQTLGQLRVAPSELREIIGKKDGDKIARAAVVFAKGGDVLKIQLAPYFSPKPSPSPEPSPSSSTSTPNRQSIFFRNFGWFAIIASMISVYFFDLSTFSKPSLFIIISATLIGSIMIGLSRIK